MNQYRVLLNAMKYEDGRNYTEVKSVVATYERLKPKFPKITISHVSDIEDYPEFALIVYQTKSRSGGMVVHKNALPKKPIDGIDAIVLGNAIILEKTNLQKKK